MSTVTEVWAYRTLISNLTKRELKSRYKKSVLGRLWALINPAATLGIYTLVFGVFLKAVPPVSPTGLSNFALWLFAALAMWNAFAAIVNGSISSMFDAGGLIGKVYFPPETPAIANVFSSLLQTVTECLILVVIMIIVGNTSWTFLLLPWLVVQVVMLGLGLGLMASLLNIYFRDVGYLVVLLMQLLFYGTPIVYSLTDIPERVGGFPIRDLVELNPLTQVTYQARQALYLLQWPTATQLLYTAATAIITLLVGWSVFARKAPVAIEEI